MVPDDGEEVVVNASGAGDEGVGVGVAEVGVVGGEGGKVASVGGGDGDIENAQRERDWSSGGLIDADGGGCGSGVILAVV